LWVTANNANSPDEDAPAADAAVEDAPAADARVEDADAADSSRLSRRRQRRTHRKTRGLAWPVAIGLLVRYVVAPFTGQNRDLGVWVRASEMGAYHLGLFARPDFSYPSGWGNVLQALGVLLPRIGLPASSFATRSTTMAPLAGLNHFSIFITSPWFNVAFKSVLFAFDLGTSLLLFALVLQMTGDERRARLAFVLFFLNPFVIFESAAHGAFDVMVGFFLLLGVYAVLNHRYGLAGAAISLGVLVKASPVVLLPVLLVAVVLDSRASRPDRRLSAVGAAVGRFVGAGIGVAVVCSVPELLSHSVSAMLSLTGARETSAPAFSSALSFYGLEVFKHMSWIPRLLGSHPTLVHVVSDASPVVVGLVGILWLLRRGLSASLLLAVTAAEFAALLLTAPQTQAQYLIWILPVVVALVAACEVGKFEFVTLSVAGVVIFAFVYGPGSYVFTLGAFTSLVSLHSLTSGALGWIADNRPGLLTVRETGTANGLVVPFVIVAQLLLIRRGLFPGRLARTATSAEAPAEVAPALETSQAQASVIPALETSRPEVVRSAGTVRLALRCAQLLVAGMLAAALVVVVFVGSGRPSGSVRLVSGSVQDGSLRTVIQLSPGAAQRSLRLVAFPVRSSPVTLRHLYVFYDGAYPEVGSSALITSAITGRLSDELALRNGHIPVSTVDAAQLSQVLRDTASAAGAVIVDITGVLPSSSFGPLVDLVKPWLDRGGVLLWGGATIGDYIAGPDAVRNGKIVVQRQSAQCVLSCVKSVPPTTSECAASGAKSATGQCIIVCQVAPATGRRACGPTSSSPTGPVAPVATPAGAALEISYRNAVPPQSLVGTASGGQGLGWSGDGGSSVTTVGVGAGAVVVFGGPVDENQDITQDMAAILLSHAYDISGPLSYTTVSTSRFAAGGGRYSWSVKLPASAATSPHPIEIFAMDPNVFGTLTASWTVAVPH